MLSFLYLLAAFSILSPFIFKNPKKPCLIIQWLSLGLVITLPLSIPFSFNQHFTLITFGGVTLSIELLFDRLCWVMLCSISFLSLCIYHYSHNYLLSDSTQPRFFGQLSALVASVNLLMLSGNLFTAFIAWQMIGLSLYLLLNHYHFDMNANKAAKKKFIINRLGDLAFLLAVIQSFLYFGSTSYSILLHQTATPMSLIILGLIFIAVMTKSAQFPFHIWLPDTLEAPTPVSALMHAGVINAGGFLLARLSPLLIQHKELLQFIFFIGLVTAFIGSFIMLTQTEIKKTLAYSTMSQMGYMIMQCGLGCFSSAIFHLIAHGFFKASLFLSSGDLPSLGSSSFISRKQVEIKHSLKAILFSLILLCLGYFLLKKFTTTLEVQNPILWLFLGITLYQLGYAVFRSNISSISILLVIASAFFAYTFLITFFNDYLKNIIQSNIIIKPSEIGLTLFIVLSSTLLALIKHKTHWVSKKIYLLSFNKLYIEEFYRNYLLKPLRLSGEWLYRQSTKVSIISFFQIVFLIFFPLVSLLYAFFYRSHNDQLLLYFILHLAIWLAWLLLANRTKTLWQLLFSLTFTSLSFGNLGLFSQKNELSFISLYYFINTLPILLVICILLAEPHSSKQSTYLDKNALSPLQFYISLLLMSLIGIPGTASFITEFYMLKAFWLIQPAISIFFALGMILLALVVLHALQAYIFCPYSSLLKQSNLPKYKHFLAISIISLSIFNGFNPGLLLNSLAN